MTITSPYDPWPADTRSPLRRHIADHKPCYVFTGISVVIFVSLSMAPGWTTLREGRNNTPLEIIGIAMTFTGVPLFAYGVIAPVMAAINRAAGERPDPDRFPRPRFWYHWAGMETSPAVFGLVGGPLMILGLVLMGR